MKSFDLRLKVDEIRHNEITERNYKAEINLTDSTDFSEIIEFMEDVKKVWKKGMAAIKAGFYIELEVTEAVYENWLCPEKNLVQKSYNRWVSVPTHEQDSEGIYLRPDPRYTDECRDMYLTKDTLKDLAYTLR